ncbi:hypothetical protein E4U55_005265 [Claviceps digitariae]|nr:hypothetical protein E4U55_005265 [Claviceps digitariae]
MSSSKSNAKHTKRSSTKSASRSSRVKSEPNPPAASSSSSSSKPNRYPLPEDGSYPSFLFVVNELVIDFDQPETRHIGIPKDDWHNYLPPQRREQYVAEVPSEVMRFQNGRVTRASSDMVHYSWSRHNLSTEGGILGQPAVQPAFFAHLYKRASVFSCNPLLPIVVAEDDVLLRPEAHLHALHFLHARPATISQASYQFDYPPSVPLPPHVARQGPPIKYVAGAGASWIPSLVPATYANPYKTTPSGGLGGELGILLGLMAFHSVRPSERGRTVSEVFLGRQGESTGLWKDYHWRSTSSPPGYPLSMQDTPRGFLVHICLDPENPSGSTAHNLASLEWQQPLVTG